MAKEFSTEPLIYKKGAEYLIFFAGKGFDVDDCIEITQPSQGGGPDKVRYGRVVEIRTPTDAGADDPKLVFGIGRTNYKSCARVPKVN